MVDARKKREPVERDKPVVMYLNPEDRKVVKASATTAGLSVSAYLRACCLSTRLVAPAADPKSFGALAQTNADLARLGNLMKLYLQEPQPDHAAATRLIQEMLQLQVEIKAIIRKIKL